MGNRTSLYFENYCEFEANNCLPVTWLALFDPDEFVIETRREDSEEYEVAGYRTSQPMALRRVELTIDKLKGRTPVWAFLRPLEILRDELKRCPPEESIVLDVTQLRSTNEAFERRVVQCVEAFSRMVDALTGDEERDLALLNRLVNDLSIGHLSSVVHLTPEERMFGWWEPTGEMKSARICIL